MVNRLLLNLIIEYGSKTGKSILNAYSKVIKNTPGA